VPVETVANTENAPKFVGYEVSYFKANDNLGEYAEQAFGSKGNWFTQSRFDDKEEAKAAQKSLQSKGFATKVEFVDGNNNERKLTDVTAPQKPFVPSPIPENINTEQLEMNAQFNGITAEEPAYAAILAQAEAIEMPPLPTEAPPDLGENEISAEQDTPNIGEDAISTEQAAPILLTRFRKPSKCNRRILSVNKPAIQSHRPRLLKMLTDTRSRKPPR
jgi:hypothetical protein